MPELLSSLNTNGKQVKPRIGSRPRQTYVAPVVTAHRVVVGGAAIPVADQHPVPSTVGELRNNDGVKAGWVPTVEAVAAAKKWQAVQTGTLAAVTPVVAARRVVVLMVAEPVTFPFFDTSRTLGGSLKVTAVGVHAVEVAVRAGEN